MTRKGAKNVAWGPEPAEPVAAAGSMQQQWSPWGVRWRGTVLKYIYVFTDLIMYVYILYVSSAWYIF